MRLLSVSDTGIGMTPEQMGRLFQAVHAGRRLDHAQVRRHRPGPGDQPTLLPDDGRRHRGGERYGEGSTFTVRLPAVLDEAAQASAQSVAS